MIETESGDITDQTGLESMAQPMPLAKGKIEAFECRNGSTPKNHSIYQREGAHRLKISGAGV
ncbi:MAG: hypothetical protein CBD27_01555 [Rhodospirillaceae bacterium TMED167]|nr:hypothetical protein [Rhodospirillaceae bacterium]OUW30434.1 MAG: hypothetical protein CBD27_01555 [Rhodospirillaceae bacterium TMED167]|tara:strand:+ start:285 stop:470 length:186 start_codon:yes stop_codon:yes gene_type:complete